MTHNPRKELPQIPLTFDAQDAARPSFSTMPFPDLNPPGVQYYVVEHIVKSDDSAAHLSTQTFRAVRKDPRLNQTTKPGDLDWTSC